jgi:hypothetical protein
MPRLLPYLLKNLARNRTRSLLTLFGLVIGVGIFSFLIAAEFSIHDQIDRMSQETILITQQKDQW